MREDDGREQLDTAICYLILVVAGVLISLWALVLQRRRLDGCPVEPGQLRWLAVSSSILFFGVQGYFFTTARDAAARAEPCARPTAQLGLLALALTLVAALIRLYLAIESGSSSSAGAGEELKEGTSVL